MTCRSANVHKTLVAGLPLDAERSVFDTIFEVSLNEIYVFDPRTLCFTQVNRVALRNLGYSMNEMRTLTPLDINAGSTLQHFEEQVKPLRSAKDNKVEFQAVQQRKDGSHYPVEGCLHLIVLESVPLFIAMVTDITARREAEDTICRSGARMREVLDAVEDGIVAINARGKIELFNRAAEKLFGYGAGEVIGRHVSVLMPQQASNGTSSVIASYLEGGAATMMKREVVGRRKDGKTFPMELSAGSTQTDGDRKCTVTIRDISQRKHTEEKLRQSESMLARAQEIANIGSAICTGPPDTGVLFWSDHMFRIYGRDPSLGPPTCMRQYLSQIVHPQDRVRVAGELEAAAASSRPWNLEYRIVRADGSVRRVHNVSEPELDMDGQAVRWISCCHDVTEHRDLEREYRQAQKMEAVGTLTSGIAHDYNNVLMGMFGCIDLALNEINSKSRAAMYLHEARRAGESGASLSRELLTFTRRQDFTPTDVDLDRVIASAATIIRSMLGESIETRIRLNSPSWRF